MSIKNQIISGAEPIYYPGNEVGVLLIHGFTGTPSEMRELGQHLNQIGYTVLAPRLFGHGTNIADINRAYWENWVASVEDAYHMLKTSCQKVIVAGLSMGGALALYVGSYLDVDGVIAMATPFGMAGSVSDQKIMPYLKFISIFKPFRKYDPILGKGWYSPENAKDNNSLAGYIPLAAAYELDQFLKFSKHELKKITAPTQLIFSKADQTVAYENMKKIQNVVGESVKCLITFEKSGHVLTMDGEKEEVFKQIEKFIKSIL